MTSGSLLRLVLSLIFIGATIASVQAVTTGIGWAEDGHEGHNHSLQAADTTRGPHEGHDHGEQQADAAVDAHEGHDHGEQAADTTVDAHEGHDHGEEAAEGTADPHEGHDHEEDGLVKLSETAMKLAGVALSRVERSSIGMAIELPGEIGFNEDRLVHVTPRFAGIAKEARYRVGDYVKAGEVIAVVESNESLTPYSIKASMSGWIIERHITPGEFVSEESSIYVLADLSTVWVNLAVYQKDAEYIRPGLEVSLQAVGCGSCGSGKIEYVTPVLDFDSRSIIARMVLPNPDNSWRPGTFVQASVNTGPGEEGLVVERGAVQVLADEHVVFVHEGEGNFRSVPVTVGESDSVHTRILSGLDEGVEYVAEGAFELKAKIVTGSLDPHAGHGH